MQQKSESVDAIFKIIIYVRKYSNSAFYTAVE